ncbi:hypothetical protein M758_UG290600 [Ceratodon purpureus]|nr:hypothetical protein M758_UG290600 [Ceratodon purpureus]KAG0596867.1 hypothetical protein M758_UG290600 [Ceratodon purpureus]
MATGYMVYESLGFCTEYFSLFKHTRRRVWDPEEELRDAGDLLLGAPRQRRLTNQELEQVHDYVICHSMYTAELMSVWKEEQAEWQRGEREFPVHSAEREWGVIVYNYPDHLNGNFPSFGSWLNRHIRRIREEGFPVEPELLELQCQPSEVAMSYKAMWAYGCYYRCNPDNREGHVTIDCGIASVAEDASTLDVEILKDILLVTYGKMNCVVMQGDWIKATDQGRAAKRNDRLGFWSVLFTAQEHAPDMNPFVFPATVSQVYFMDNGVDRDWKTVLRHDGRSRRITEDKGIAEFETASTNFPPPNGVPAPNDGVAGVSSQAPTEDVVLDAENVRNLYEENAIEDEDAYLDDADYEDEITIQYVE